MHLLCNWYYNVVFAKIHQAATNNHSAREV